jgi:hypothetical protein
MGVFLTTYVVGNFQISFAKVGPREGQLAIILFALISMIFKYPLNLFNSGVKGIGAFTLFDIVGLIAIFILIVVAVHSITDTISYLKRFEKTYKVNSFLEYIHKTQFMRNLDKDHPVKKMNKDLVNLERKIYRGNKK